MGKKTNWIKPTDENKAWNRRTKPKSYFTDSIAPHETILIFCEGQTEEIYFDSFPVTGIDVKCIDMEGQSKTKLVEEAVKRKKKLEREGYKFTQTWCVFDMDVKEGEDEFADFDNAIYMAQSKKFDVAYSNDCYEVWYYLHYHYTDQENRRDFYYDELSKLWNISYTRKGKSRGECYNTYKRLLNDPRADQERAILHARKLHEEQKDKPYHQQNPVSTIYLLVEELNKNIKK